MDPVEQALYLYDAFVQDSSPWPLASQNWGWHTGSDGWENQINSILGLPSTCTVPFTDFFPETTRFDRKLFNRFYLSAIKDPKYSLENMIRNESSSFTCAAAIMQYSRQFLHFRLLDFRRMGLDAPMLEQHKQALRGWIAHEFRRLTGPLPVWTRELESYLKIPGSYHTTLTPLPDYEFNEHWADLTIGDLMDNDFFTVLTDCHTTYAASSAGLRQKLTQASCSALDIEMLIDEYLKRAKRKFTKTEKFNYLCTTLARRVVQVTGDYLFANSLFPSSPRPDHGVCGVVVASSSSSSPETPASPKPRTLIFLKQEPPPVVETITPPVVVSTPSSSNLQKKQRKRKLVIVSAVSAAVSAITTPTVTTTATAPISLLMHKGPPPNKMIALPPQSLKKK